MLETRLEPPNFGLKVYDALTTRQGRNEVCGIRDQRGKVRDQKGGIKDHSPRIRDHKPWDRDQHFYEGSEIRLYHSGGSEIWIQK